MAITIMFCLTFGTISTMVLVPVLYTTLNRVQPTEQDSGAAADMRMRGNRPESFTLGML